MSVQVVIVTGAASGIGAAIALSFAKLGSNLCITDINVRGLKKVCEECQNISKKKVLEVVADLRKDEDRESIVKRALKEFGRIDVLINCAGIFQNTKLQDPDIIETFDKIFATNLRSAVAMTKKALPALIESKGCVINISSIASSQIIDNALVYCMSKAALATFTKCAALELANLGIRVNCISPGPVKTNIYLSSGISEDKNDQFWDSLAHAVPLKKCVKAQEIAELAVYLASDKAASITASDFVIDAGMLLGTAGNNIFGNYAPKNNLNETI